MPDNTPNNINTSSDILGQLMSRSTASANHLANIDTNLTKIVTGNGSNLSQSSARASINKYRDQVQNSRFNTPEISRLSRNRSRRNIDSFDDIIDEFYKGVSDGLTSGLKESTSEFTKGMREELSVLAKSMGLELNDLPRMLGKSLSESVKNSQLGKSIQNNIRDLSRSALRSASSIIDNAGAKYVASNQGAFRDASGRNRSWSEVKSYWKQQLRSGSAAGGSSSLGNDIFGSGLSSNSSDKTESIDYIGSINDNVESILMLLSDNYSSGAYSKKVTTRELNDLAEQGDVEGIVNKLNLKDAISSGSDLGKLSDISSMIGEGGDITKLLNAGNSELLTSLGPEAGSLIQGVLGKAGGALATTGAEAGVAATAGAGATTAAGMAGGSGVLAAGAAGGPLGIAAVIVAMIALDQLSDALGPATEGVKQFGEALKATSKRYFTSQREALKEEQKRLAADINTMIEQPFKIMEKAAEEWYQAWDNNLRTINQTQGYTKADLQNLMGNFAERIRKEQLQKSVSAVDITNDLAKVLEQGLSGTVAEEFAYLAAKLNAAVPTQDFFSYADTYASVAANALQAGASEAEAIQKANAQLEQFASNVLYASRELAGGFSTGLQNASSLFSDAVKIANTARTGDASKISAVLTSVSAIVGAVAPDLVDGLVSNIVSAATGGNSDQLTALRSLAGTGASNTAFLQAFAADPQKVFETLFNKLSDMQQMSADNYMEVAEALADTFGVSMDALARVDFSALADSVASMQVNADSLRSNISLLRSGESTTTAEQLKMQQINEMIIDEGLSYVLDNEAARMVQEHMWDQELAQQMQEATYGVELIGATQELLLGISETIHGIFSILNPFSWAEKIGSVSISMLDQSALKSDLKTMLELGKVGNGNTKALKNLTTYNANALDRHSGLLELMGGSSIYSGARSQALIGGLRSLTESYTGGFGAVAGRAVLSGISNALSNGRISDVLGLSGSKGGTGFGGGSKYGWAFVGKSLSTAIANSTPQGELVQTSASARMAEKSNQKLQDYLDSVKSAVDNNMTYSEWRGTSSQYGIKDLDAALEEAGIKESTLEGNFRQHQAQKASEYNMQKDELEKKFWEEGQKFWTETYPHYAQEQINRQDIEIQWLTDIYNQLVVFYNSFMQDWIAQAWRADFVSNDFENRFLTNDFENRFLTNDFETKFLTEDFENRLLTTDLENRLLTNDLENRLLTTDLENRLLATDLENRLLSNDLENRLLTTDLENRLLATDLEGRLLGADLETRLLQNDIEERLLNRDLETRLMGKDIEKDWLEQAWYNDWLGGKNNKNTWSSWITKDWQRNWLDRSWTNFFNAWSDKNARYEAYSIATGDAYLDAINSFDTDSVLYSGDSLYKNKKSNNSGVEDAVEEITSLAKDSLEKEIADTSAVLSQSVIDLRSAENASNKDDMVIDLAQSLIQNTKSLKDPQAQTNVLLSQLVVLAQAILQAENTSSGAALATSLSGLATDQIQSV